MKGILYVVCVVLIGVGMFIGQVNVVYSIQIPARNIIAFDRNNVQRNLQDILNQIVPTNATTDLTGLTANATELNTLDGALGTLTASELNILDGISANVTAANLNILTGGGGSTLHTHFLGASTTTLNQAYSNTGGAATRIIDLDKGNVSFNLTDATNDYHVRIDNTTSGTIDDALLIQASSTGVITDAIDASDAEIVNAVNAGDNTYTGTTSGISFTNFLVTSSGRVTANGGMNLNGGTAGAGDTIDWGSGANDDLTATDVTDLTDGGTSTLHSHAVSAVTVTTLNQAYTHTGSATAVRIIDLDKGNVSFNLTDATNDYHVRIDNTTSGTVDDALLIQASGASGSAITDAIDVSDAEILTALNIGANQITGTAFKFDGVGQLEVGAGGGGGGRGTGIITFIGGGAIDSTKDGDIVIQPDDAGIVDFPAGTTVRLPPASPIENRNGLFWDEVNDKLCIDKSTDLCTSALTLAAFSLNKEDVKILKKSIPVLSSFVSQFDTKTTKLMYKDLSQKDRERISKILGISTKQLDRLYSFLDSDEVKWGTKTYSKVYDQGEAQLSNGSASIELCPEFLKLVEITKQNPLSIQVTPLTTDIQGILVVSKKTNRYFVVEEANGGKSNAWFSWEISAKEKEGMGINMPSEVEFKRKKIAGDTPK